MNLGTVLNLLVSQSSRLLDLEATMMATKSVIIEIEPIPGTTGDGGKSARCFFWDRTAGRFLTLYRWRADRYIDCYRRQGYEVELKDREPGHFGIADALRGIRRLAI